MTGEKNVSSSLANKGRTKRPRYAKAAGGNAGLTYFYRLGTCTYNGWFSQYEQNLYYVSAQNKYEHKLGINKQNIENMFVNATALDLLFFENFSWLGDSDSVKVFQDYMSGKGVNSNYDAVYLLYLMKYKYDDAEKLLLELNWPKDGASVSVWSYNVAQAGGIFAEIEARKQAVLQAQQTVILGMLGGQIANGLLYGSEVIPLWRDEKTHTKLKKNGNLISSQAEASYKKWNGKTPVIGKMPDLNKPGAVNPQTEYKVADLLPNQGSPQANWQQNSSVLRSVMGRGVRQWIHSIVKGVYMLIIHENKSLNEMLLILQPSEAVQLIGYLEQLLKSPQNIGREHRHLNDKSYQKEITVCLMEGSDISCFHPDIIEIIKKEL